MDRPSPYTVRIKDQDVSVRVTLIAQGVFEAVGRYAGSDFIIKGTTVEDALERLQRIASDQKPLR